MGSPIFRKLALVGGLALSTAAVAGPTPAMLAGTCAACHGTHGSSAGYIPSLAGATPEYFTETMKAFKSGARKATVMDRVAKGYSDEEITAMAGYFAKQPLIPMKQSFVEAKAASGKKLHDKYCEKCHEEGGKKSEDGGILAGQSMLYLAYSMEDFQKGDREMPKKMKTKLDELLKDKGHAGLDAVLHFYGSQK